MTDFAAPDTTSHPPAKSRNLAHYFTLENVLWATLILAAIATRFWDLGYRTQHHDESLHTYYSWLFATTDNPYIHNPLTHGPFLFHANALVYLLLPDNDYTSRIMPALFGVLTVWMPWLLRSPRLLGRWGALFAGYALLISPAMLYYTRYIRHDPYMVAGCLLLAIAVFRYLEAPRRRWIIIAFATVAFLLANHELVLATFLFMVGILWLSILLSHLRPLIVPHLITVVLLGIAAVLWMDTPFPPIPWRRPPAAALSADQMQHYLLLGLPAIVLIVAVIAAIALIRKAETAAIVAGALSLATLGWLIVAERRLPDVRDWTLIPVDQHETFLTTNEFYSALLQHPFVQAFLLIAIAFVIGCVATIRWMLRDKPAEIDGPQYILGSAKPNTVAYGVLHALHDPLGIAIGVLVSLVIWLLLFTSLLQNQGGIGTGTYETNSTLLYWLGQHGVQRGGQPWFYFITLGLQYEWLGMFVSLVGTLLLAWRIILWFSGKHAAPNMLWHCFTVGWFLGMLIILSWAGEKMPWLIMHIALPGILVGAWMIDEIVEGAITWYRAHGATARAVQKHVAVALSLGIILLYAGWFYVTARMTHGTWQNVNGAWLREVPAATLNEWWIQAIPPLAALFLIAIAIWVIGPRKTIYSTLVATFVVLSLFQIHTGFRMSFIDGDIAIDTMIYNTASPDIGQLPRELTATSEIAHGDPNALSIVYDSCSIQWPLNWYFKDMDNAHLGSWNPANQPDVFIVNPAKAGQCGFPTSIPGYTQQDYVMLWHENEDASYRRFAIAPELAPGRSAWLTAGQPHDIPAILKSIYDSVQYAGTTEGQIKLFRQVMFRDQTAPLNWGGYPMTVYIKNDILPAYNEVRYGVEQP